MLKSFRHNSGQAIGAELVVTFVLVVTAILAISTYFRRAMQARVRDAVIYVRNEAETATMNSDGFGQRIHLQYEPYYVEAEAQTEQKSTDTARIDASGYFIRDTSQGRIVTSNSVQLAPKERN